MLLTPSPRGRGLAPWRIPGTAWRWPSGRLVGHRLRREPRDHLLRVGHHRRERPLRPGRLVLHQGAQRRPYGVAAARQRGQPRHPRHHAGPAPGDAAAPHRPVAAVGAAARFGAAAGRADASVHESRRRPPERVQEERRFRLLVLVGGLASAPDAKAAQRRADQLVEHYAPRDDRGSAAGPRPLADQPDLHLRHEPEGHPRLALQRHPDVPLHPVVLPREGRRREAPQGQRGETQQEEQRHGRRVLHDGPELQGGPGHSEEGRHDYGREPAQHLAQLLPPVRPVDQEAGADHADEQRVHPQELQVGRYHWDHRVQLQHGLVGCPSRRYHQPRPGCAGPACGCGCASIPPGRGDQQYQPYRAAQRHS
mmetsp:Transcript_104273/g.283279  ORF Transcript_104273/g.283279 Transcript_104273/m.283279 type:complete len:366 (-) Transcript_104273:759-1856(-)